MISTYFQTQRKLRYLSSMNVIASITFRLCWGSNRAVSLGTDRFKTNFDSKTAFTTTRGYIKKLSSLKLVLNKYRR